ncbi:MAG: class II aldolase/adducin family protein [Burkholderiales bacterium]
MDSSAEKASSVKLVVSPAEWAARVELAAIYRLVEHNGWAGDIFNHSSMRVPGEERMFLIKRHDMLYNEVTASNLVKVSMDADLDEKAGVNRPGFILHGGVLRARPDVLCAVHIHTDVGSAISGLSSGLRMVSQNALRLYNRIAYHDFEGITESFDESVRIVRNLGDKQVLILRNHGLMTVAGTARGAYKLMLYLYNAAKVQLMMEATGQPLAEISREICEATAAQQARHDSSRDLGDWPACLRMLDKLDDSYRQ